MDRHNIAGVTARDVAEAHQQDLKVQDKYGCKALTYWFDEERGTAFCLIDAKDKASVEEMHDEAHGLIPNQIIEVNNKLVDAFLGRIEDPKKTDDSKFLLIQEPAFRAVLVADLNITPLYQFGYDDKTIQRFIEQRIKIMQKQIINYSGREIKQTDGRFTASFSSITNSVDCATEIQQHIKEFNTNQDVKVQTGIGISAGEPVTDKEGLFGEVVQLAQRLCYISTGGQVYISPIVQEQYAKENFGKKSHGIHIKSLDPDEIDFLNRLMDVTENAWNEEKFSINDYCRQIGVSRSQLYRKTLSLTGFSSSNFLKNYKLNQALKLINSKQGNISSVAIEAGFSNPSYFSKCFYKHFGVLPSQFVNRIK